METFNDPQPWRVLSTQETFGNRWIGVLVDAAAQVSVGIGVSAQLLEEDVLVAPGLEGGIVETELQQCRTGPRPIGLVVEVAGSDPQQDAPFGDTAFCDQPIQRRDQLAPGQVARATEDDEEMSLWFRHRHPSLLMACPPNWLRIAESRRSP